MMASVIKYIHGYEVPRRKVSETSLLQANSVSNANAHISSQPVTLVHRKNGGFVTSLAPEWNMSELARKLNMTKDLARWIVLEFFLQMQHIQYSYAKHRGSGRILSFSFSLLFNLNHITLGLIFLL